MTPGRPLLWTEVQALQRDAAQHFDVRIVRKDQDPWSLALAAVLDGLAAARERLPAGLRELMPTGLSGASFLRDYHSTYPTHIAMVPMTDATDYVRGLDHELGHWTALQGTGGDATSAQDPYRMASGVTYVALYAAGDLRDLETMREFCAHAEFDAECGAAELYHMLTGRLDPPEAVSERFCGPAYLLREEDLELGRGIYRRRATSIAQTPPLYLSVVSRWMQGWFRQHTPDVLAR